MNSIQGRIVTLMKEISDICKENNLKYILFNKTAYMAMTTHSFDGDSYIADMAMPAKDAKKFIEIVEGGRFPDREIESVANNPDMPGMFLRYVDRTTTFIDTSHEDRYKKGGVNVKIHILREKKPEGNDLRQERWLEILNVENRGPGRKKMVFKATTMLTLLGKKKTAKKIYDSLFEEKKGGEYYYYKIPRAAVIKFPRRIMDEVELMEFEGELYPVPVNQEDFLEKIYGKNWESKAKKFKEKKTKFEVISSLDLPYEEYEEYLASAGINKHELIKYRGNYKVWRKRVIGPYDKMVKRDWTVVKRTTERVSLWEEYYPQKENILKLYSEEKWDELEEIMAHYSDRIEYWRKQKLGLCFDKEIWEVMEGIWKHDGKEEYAEKVRKLVPDVHWTNLDVTMKEHGIDISYLNEGQSGAEAGAES